MPSALRRLPPLVIFVLAISMQTLPSAFAYDNGAPGSRLPVLGWSSWVALGPGDEHPIFDFCDEHSVKAASDAFVALGFKAAGYTGFHLDDCWANRERNASGYLQGELDHFPNGIKPVVDHVHAHGMDFGLYTCAGDYTCVGHRPGSGGKTPHWQKDADVFAEWGVDWVKQDNCNTDGMGKPENYFGNMSRALNATGRPICFAMCEWGVDNPWEWGDQIAQSWRATEDHTGVWESTKKIIGMSAAIPAEHTGRPYGWNDLDMLETGNYEQAAHANGKESTMTAIEYKTEFSMWAISASPLVVTTPIMNCSAGYRETSPDPRWAVVSDSGTGGSRGMKDNDTCNIAIKMQSSDASCHLGESFGCYAGASQSMWTEKGCRGTFLVNGATVVCDDKEGASSPNGQGRHYCGPVECVPWISDLQKEILFNTDVIGINQDVTPQGRPIKDGDLTVWARKLTGGDVAVALYNQEDVAQEIGFMLSAVGWPAVGKTGNTDDACVRDLWLHADVSRQLDKNTGQFGPVVVAPHESKVYRVSTCPPKK